MASEVACENGAPDESQRSAKICEENGTSLNARNLKCSVCGTPVKGHFHDFGHWGQGKCVLGFVSALASMIEEQERVNEERAEEVREIRKFGVEREAALLTKIEQQDKRIAALENDVKRSEFTTKKKAPVEQRLVDRPVVQGNVPNAHASSNPRSMAYPSNTTRRTNYGPNHFYKDRRRHRRCRSIQR